MQLPKEEQNKSVGEKASPLPWLSIGASVMMLIFDFTCVDFVRKSPEYSTIAVAIARGILVIFVL